MNWKLLQACKVKAVKSFDTQFLNSLLKIEALVLKGAKITTSQTETLKQYIAL